MEIFLPPLGDATTATIEHWYKQPGEAVAPSDALLVARTDRFEWDVPATVEGTIAEVLAPVGDSIAIGAVLARIESEQQGGDANGRVPAATPVARRIAAAHGVDLATITGSGRGGRVTGSDVRALIGGEAAVAAAPPPVALQEELVEQKTMPDAATVVARAPQTAIAPVSHLHRDGEHAKRTTPHALTAIDVDLGKIEAYVARHGGRMARRGIALDHSVVIAAAAVQLLRGHRLLNSAYSDDGIILRSRVDLRVVRGGTSAVIANAADLNVQGLARALNVSDQAQEHDPTFTITTGGAVWEHALIEGSGSAALTIGNVERRPVVIDVDGRDEIAIRPVALLTLAYNARTIMPYEADAFLGALKHDLEHVDPV